VILVGDCRARLRELPDQSVHTVVTSPPYFNLRDYRADGQIGLERTPDEYIDSLVAALAEVWRVLRDDGTLWLNLGDTYASGGGGARGTRSSLESDGPKRHALEADRPRGVRLRASCGLKAKDLIGIPWMVAFALRAQGWYLRQEVIWSKVSPMPERVDDRPTQAHEQLFLMSKRPRYFYDADAIREPYAAGSVERIENGFKDRYADAASGGHRGAYGGSNGEQVNPAGRNKRSVWTIAPYPFADAHFATFPPKLVEPCLLAGSPAQACADCGAPYERIIEGGESTWAARKAAGATWGNVENAASNGGTQRVVHGQGVSRDLTPELGRTVGFEPSCDCGAAAVPGTVLDPFAGSGTVGVVASWYGRDFIGIELNPEYAEMAERRIASEGRLGRRAAKPEPVQAEALF
jgi:DNA modification methylase